MISLVQYKDIRFVGSDQKLIRNGSIIMCPPSGHIQVAPEGRPIGLRLLLQQPPQVVEDHFVAPIVSTLGLKAFASIEHVLDLHLLSTFVTHLESIEDLIMPILNS